MTGQRMRDLEGIDSRIEESVWQVMSIGDVVSGSFASLRMTKITIAARGGLGR
jgi:tRNA G37 N-methylase TrmD